MIITSRLEGVNDVSPNAMTLHTSTGCTMPAQRAQTGTSAQLDCDVAVNGNTGCNVKAPTSNSYGPAFNAAGGGFYVMERTNQAIKVWFWTRNAPDVPAAIRNGGQSFNTDTFVSTRPIFMTRYSADCP